MSDERPTEITNYMESLTSNLAPAAISGWLQRVAEYAMELCPDNGIEFRMLGDFGEIVIPTKDATKCVIESVKTVEQQAPDIVKVILATYRARLEQL